MFLHNGGLLPWKELPIKPFTLKRAIWRAKENFEMEVKWLVLRQKIALAEIDAKLAKESEVRLALEMARFGEMEKMLPGRKASLSRAAPGLGYAITLYARKKRPRRKPKSGC